MSKMFLNDYNAEELNREVKWYKVMLLGLGIGEIAFLCFIPGLWFLKTVPVILAGMIMFMIWKIKNFLKVATHFNECARREIEERNMERS